MPDSLLYPLNTYHIKNKAKFIDFAGWSMPFSYDGTIKAANRDEARDEIMRQAQYFFQINNQFTPDYTATEIDVL